MWAVHTRNSGVHRSYTHVAHHQPTSAPQEDIGGIARYPIVPRERLRDRVEAAAPALRLPAAAA